MSGLLAQPFDVGDEVRDDGLDALVELRGFVGRGADLGQRLLVAQDQVLGRLILAAQLVDEPREIDRVPGLVVGLLREAARQIGVVAVVAELALRLGEQRPRFLVGARREARHTGLIGLGEQRARLAQVLRFDRGELGVAEQRLRFVGAAACAADVARLEPPRGGIEALAGLRPELGGERRGVRIGRVGPRLDDCRERHVGYLGRFASLGEGARRRCKRAADSFHVAAARKVGFGCRVGLGTAPERCRRQQVGADRARLFERAVSLGKERGPQVLLGRSTRRKCGEQANKCGEPSQGHRALQSNAFSTCRRENMSRASGAGCVSLHIAPIPRVRVCRPPAKCGGNHRPLGGLCLDSHSMGVKYYTHFVLTGEAAAGSDQEFSGVVEVNQATDQRYETKEIEALLARNFDLRSGDVRLINWARLQ